MRVRQYQLWGYKTALEVASVKTKEETEDVIIPHLFPVVLHYLACSSSSVLVVWSHTEDGPQYWIGPG